MIRRKEKRKGVLGRCIPFLDGCFSCTKLGGWSVVFHGLRASLFFCICEAKKVEE